MTDREKFIVMAYTGVSMLDWDVFHERVAKLMGRPVYTHEFSLDVFTDELKEKVKSAFLELCSQDTGWRPFDEDNHATWPADSTDFLVWTARRELEVLMFYVSQNLPFWTDGDTIIANHYIKKWMPISEPCEEEES